MLAQRDSLTPSLSVALAAAVSLVSDLLLVGLMGELLGPLGLYC